jgi:hypothetical protein
MSEATCPYCGARQTDLYEFWPDRHGVESWDAETECGSCERPVIVRCDVSVDYRIVKPLTRGEADRG